MKQNLNRVITISLLFFGIISLLQINLVCADVAVVNDVKPWTRQTDNHTVLNITVTHNNFYSGHFVDSILLDFDGSIKSVDLQETIPADQSRGARWVFQYDMGIVSGAPLVRVGAYCNIHGGGMSAPVPVPEFSTLQITLVAAFLALSLMFLRYKKLKI